MSKYIIEFEDEPCYQNHGKSYYQCKQVDIWTANDSALGRMTPLDKALDEAYQKGLNDSAKVQESATDAAYQCGLNAAWEAARKICLGKEDGGISNGELLEIFKVGSDYSALKKYSASEAIAMLRDYEQQKADAEIKVGDEVCFVFAGGETIEPFIVFSIEDDNGKKYYEGIQTSDGRWVSGGLKYFKTGRHFPQVAELLKAMKGGAE